MKAHLTRLFKGTFIYSSGQLLVRVITFFLLPLTTSYLKPEDYGIIGTLAIIGQLFNGIFTLGFGVALGRCYWDTEDIPTRHKLIWTAFAALLFNVLLITGLAYCFRSEISWIAIGTDNYSDLVMMTFISIGLSSALLPFSTYFRMEEKAVLVVTLSLIEIITSLGLTIYFVMFANRGAAGVIEAGLIAQVVSFVLMLSIGTYYVKPGFQWKSISEMLHIGYPYIFGLFGYFLLQCSSRYILQLFFGMDEVGLFFMGSNFAAVITLAVTGFISAWPPFFTSFLNKQEEAIKVFGRVLSYYVMAMSGIVLLFFVLARPIVFLMVQPQYHNVWTVVGTLAAAQALWGVYSISAAGLIFYKKSGWQMMMETGAGLLSIGLNFALIPLLDKEGAALATLLSFLALALVSLRVNYSLLPVQYEKERILKTVSALTVGALITFLPIDNNLVYNGFMVFTFVGFCTYLWKNCLSSSEKSMISQYLPSKALHKSLQS